MPVKSLSKYCVYITDYCCCQVLPREKLLFVSMSDRYYDSYRAKLLRIYLLGGFNAQAAAHQRHERKKGRQSGTVPKDGLS